MKNKPDIRFDGFTDAWEQRKLGEVCEYVDYRGKTPRKVNDGIFLVTAKNVKDGYIDYGASKEFISEDDYEEIMHRGIPKIGDVLITTEAPCGNVAQVDKANIALAQRIIKYRGYAELVDNTYLKHYMLAPKFQRILDTKSSGGTVKGIKGSVLHQQYVDIPSYSEQIKIGECLELVNHLITLHQRELENYKLLKKGFLQKLFPSNGDTNPSIRFDGFNDAWEQCGLGESLLLLKDGTHGTHKDVENGIYLLSAKNIKNGQVNISESERKISRIEYNSIHKNFRLQKDDVLLTIVGSIGESAILEQPYELTFQRSVAYLRPDDRLTSQFLYSTIISTKFQQELKRRQVVSAQPGIYLGDLSLIPLEIPSMSEQAQIGIFFQSLDTLITLHQRELENYQELKKGFLQKMFV